MAQASQRRVSSRIRHEQILGVAKELFAQRGYRGTTTRQIAQRLGINETILFRHFPHKEDLYWAVVQSECNSPQSQDELDRKLSASRPRGSGKTDDRAVFRTIAKEILEHSERDPKMMRLLLFTALENHRLSKRFYSTFIAEKYEILAAYIRRRVREGAFRSADPLLAARSFVGMVIYHVLIQELFGGKDYQRFDPRHVSETLTGIWFEGMKARARRTASPGNHR